VPEERKGGCGAAGVEQGGGYLGSRTGSSGDAATSLSTWQARINASADVFGPGDEGIGGNAGSGWQGEGMVAPAMNFGCGNSLGIHGIESREGERLRANRK